MKQINAFLIMLGLIISFAVPSQAQSAPTVKKRLATKTVVVNDTTTLTYNYKYDTDGRLISRETGVGDKMTIDWSTYPDSVTIAFSSSDSRIKPQHTKFIFLDSDSILRITTIDNEIYIMQLMSLTGNQISSIIPQEKFLNYENPNYDYDKTLFGNQRFEWENTMVNPWECPKGYDGPKSVIKRRTIQMSDSNHLNNFSSYLPNYGGWFVTNAVSDQTFPDDYSKIASEAGLLGMAPNKLTAMAINYWSQKSKMPVTCYILHWELDSDEYPNTLKYTSSKYSPSGILSEENVVVTFVWETVE